jgi:magnesium-transporting ATPase (P-type)
MKKINIVRLLLGGLVAGIVVDILGYLVDGLWLQQSWSDEMLALGKNEFSNTQIVQFNIIGIVFGIVAILIYVGFRPLFGANWKTAIYAGVTAWIIGVLLPNSSFMLVTELFSKHLALNTTAGGLVEAVAGTVAGAALYKGPTGLTAR